MAVGTRWALDVRCVDPKGSISCCRLTLWQCVESHALADWAIQAAFGEMLTTHQSETNGPLGCDEDGGDRSGPFTVAAQSVPHSEHFVAAPSPEFLLDSAEVGELGDRLLAELTPFREAHAIGKTQLQRIGISV